MNETLRHYTTVCPFPHTHLEAAVSDNVEAAEGGRALVKRIVPQNEAVAVVVHQRKRHLIADAHKQSLNIPGRESDKRAMDHAHGNFDRNACCIQGKRHTGKKGTS